MPSGKSGTCEKLRDAAIIAGGLLLTFAVLLLICTIAIGGPITVFMALMAMMGPH